MSERIKVLVPRMPKAADLAGYLSRLDDSRWYTNFGQAERELRARLSDLYGGAHIVTTSSATSALELLYDVKRRRGWNNAIGLPALTFPATWLAADRIGARIVAVDVDPDTWTAPSVAGFGVPVRGATVDAAAAFGEQRVDKHQSVVFSLHATKAVGAGEGGYIVIWNEGEAEELRRMTNFGIDQRIGASVQAGTNAKLSEYAAAVALASLDSWDREPWLRLYDWYEERLPAYVKRQKRPRGVYPIMAVKLPVPAAPVALRMAELGIETRRWYWPAMHGHPHFRHLDCGPLPVTEDLSEHLLGLPYHLFLTEEDVACVCAALVRALEGM